MNILDFPQDAGRSDITAESLLNAAVKHMCEQLRNTAEEVSDISNEVLSQHMTELCKSKIQKGCSLEDLMSITSDDALEYLKTHGAFASRPVQQVRKHIGTSIQETTKLSAQEKTRDKLREAGVMGVKERRAPAVTTKREGGPSTSPPLPPPTPLEGLPLTPPPSTPPLTAAAALSTPSTQTLPLPPPTLTPLIPPAPPPTLATPPTPVGPSTLITLPPPPLTFAPLLHGEVRMKILQCCNDGDIDGLEGLIAAESTPEAKAQLREQIVAEVLAEMSRAHSLGKEDEFGELYDMAMKLIIKRPTEPEFNLLCQKADDNALTCALITAINNQQYSIVRLLVERLGAKPDREDPAHKLPLESPIQLNDLKMVQLLVELGAHPTEENKQHLLIASIHLNNVEMVRLLLEKGTDPNLMISDDLTPLTYSIRVGNIEMVRFLLEKGADPNLSNAQGWTPLTESTGQGNIEMVRLLLEKGADPNLSNAKGETPLTESTGRGNIEMVRLLLEKGADPNLSNAKGETPLTYSIGLENIEMVRPLLEKGADPNLSNAKGRSPLALAILGGLSDDGIEALKKAGADEASAKETISRIYLAHTWSVGGTSVLTGGRAINLEGIYGYYPMRQLKETLEAFFHADMTTWSEFAPRALLDPEKAEILEAISTGHPLVKKEPSKVAKDIRDGKSYVIMSGTRDHAVGIVFCRGKMYICNRGQGKSPNAIESYIINDPSKIEKAISQLQKKVEFSGMGQFNQFLEDLGFTPNPSDTFGLKDQRVGNCAEANLEAAFRALVHGITSNTEKSTTATSLKTLKTGLRAQVLHKRLAAFKRTYWLRQYLATSGDPDPKILTNILRQLNKRKKIPEVEKLKKDLQKRIDETATTRPRLAAIPDFLWRLFGN